jgi:hypothetical protein
MSTFSFLLSLLRPRISASITHTFFIISYHFFSSSFFCFFSIIFPSSSKPIFSFLLSSIFILNFFPWRVWF